MKPLFLASQPGLDFLNTSFALLPEQTTAELIGDGATLVAWLVAAGLLDEALAAKLKRRFGGAALDAAAADARKLRRWAGEWLSRWRAAPAADYQSELRRLNELLARASWQRELDGATGTLKAVERLRVETAHDLLALVAWQLALIFVEESPDLVKRCAGAGCVLWFVDRTKAHRRLFCSAAACGNRSKVAAFRERQRDPQPSNR